MSESKDQTETTSSSKAPKSKTKSMTSVIRVSAETKRKIDDLCRKAQRNHFGRKVKPEDIVGYAVRQMTNEHVSEVAESVLTNRDRFELVYKQISSRKRGMCREDFYGAILDGKLHELMAE